MLHVFFGDEAYKKGEIRPEAIFNDEFCENWMRTELAHEIVRGIDLTEYVEGDYFKSPIFGGIPSFRLSTGCQSVLVLLNYEDDDYVLRGERMGDNCLEYVLRVAEIKDIRVSMHHWMPFPEPFNIMLDELGISVCTQKELLWYYMQGVVEDFKVYPKELFG